jgi:hypothetical protein
MDCAFQADAFQDNAFQVCVGDTGGGLGLGLGYVRRVPVVMEMDDDALVLLLMTEILLNE